ncbi:LON peptidase substrate-binding domain-containing protein [Nocardia sp. IBHARD005]|uniref:LON peptidase substrate-binding domain-containing protein n=1 Tax=Nocardia sp. IBHARD005 TaxID=3457765 RepID=UPI004057DE23
MSAPDGRGMPGTGHAGTVEIPMFPLGAVLLPGESLSLQIFEPRYVALIEDCMDGRREPEFGVVLIARGHEVGGGEVRTEVGTVARIAEVIELPGSRYRVRCKGTDRIRIDKWLVDAPYPQAEAAHWPDGPGTDDSALLEGLRERADRLHTLTAQFARRNGIRRPPPSASLQDLSDDPTTRSYELAARLPIGPTDRQSALSAPDPHSRLAALSTSVDDAIAMMEFRLL